MYVQSGRKKNSMLLLPNLPNCTSRHWVWDNHYEMIVTRTQKPHDLRHLQTIDHIERVYDIIYRATISLFFTSSCWGNFPLCTQASILTDIGLSKTTISDFSGIFFIQENRSKVTSYIKNQCNTLCLEATIESPLPLSKHTHPHTHNRWYPVLQKHCHQRELPPQLNART